MQKVCPLVAAPSRFYYVFISKIAFSEGYLRPYYKLIFGMAEIADLFIDFLLKDLHFWQISLNTVAVVVGSRLVSFIGRVNRKSEIRNQHSII